MRCGQNPALEPQNAVKGTVTHHYNTPGRVRSRLRPPDLRQPSPSSSELETTNLPPLIHSVQWPREEVLEQNKCGKTGKQMTAQIRQIGTCHLPPAQRYS